MEKSAFSKLNKLLLIIFGILLLATSGLGIYYLYYLKTETQKSEADKYAPIEGVNLNEFPAVKNLEKVVQESQRSTRGVLAGVMNNKIYLGGGQGYLKPIDLAPDTLYSCQKLDESSLNVFIDYRNINEAAFREYLVKENKTYGSASDFWEKAKPGEVVLVILKKSSEGSGERVADFVYWLSTECTF
jgi:hypothetical protein